jgi:signal transduction histidine kinase
MAYLWLWSLITSLLSFVFGVFVLSNGLKRPANILWFLTCLSIAVWSFGFGMMLNAPSFHEATTWVRWLVYPASIFIPVFFLNFVYLVTGIGSRNFLICAYAVALSEQVLNAAGKFGTLAPALPFHFYPVASSWYSFYFISFFVCVIYSHILLFKKVRSSEGQLQQQVKYIGAGTAIGFCGGLTTFFLSYRISIYPWGAFVIPIYIVTVSYAILKHHLMDISIVIRNTLLYSIVTAGLAAIYAGAVTLLSYLIGTPGHLSSVIVHPFESGLIVINWFAQLLRINFGLGCFFIAATSISFGAVVWLKARTKLVNVLWFLLSISICGWAFGLGMVVRSDSYIQAYHWQIWILYPFAIMIPVLFLHFVVSFLDIERRRFVQCAYLSGLTFEILNALHQLASVGAFPSLPYYTKPLLAYYFYTAHFLALSSYSAALLYWKMRESKGLKREQIKYVLAGTIAGFCGGATTYFYIYGIPIFPYGIYAVPIYITTISYAIYKHQLLDIVVIVKKTLLYSLVSAVLAAIYVGTITLLSQVLGGRQGAASAFSSALAAIVIALIFNPLRIRTQHWIDRHFPRERLDPMLIEEAAGSFAHEMKRPLTKIGLPAQLVLRDLEDIDEGKKSFKTTFPTIKERLQFVISQSMEASSLIEAVRGLSPSSIEPFEAIELRKAILDALVDEEEVLRKHQILVQTAIPETLPLVSGRAKQLEIAFMNLIKNAAEAMSDLPSGRPRQIRIEAQAKGASVMVEVSDSGPGIKPEEMGKIFLSNFTTKGAQGTGIGLYLSRQIIEAHHGTIEAVRHDGGAKFLIWLPAAK